MQGQFKKLRQLTRNKCCGLVAGILSFATGTSASAGPNDGYAMSNDGALRGGAAVVLGRDAGSVLYNPAAIAATRRAKFDASASAYGLKITRARSALIADEADHRVREPGTERQVLVVPTAFSAAFGWPQKKLSASISVHTPSYADNEARFNLRGQSGSTNYDYHAQVSVVAFTRRYHAAGTLAWEAHPRVRLGLSLGAIYDSQVGLVRLASSASENSTKAASNIVADIDSAARVGAAELALGMQAELTSWLHVGVSARLPSVAVYSSFAGGETVSYTIRTPEGETTFSSIVDDSTPDKAPTWLTPLSIAGGIAIVRGPFDIELDGRFARAHSHTTDLWDRSSVWDLSLGGSYRVKSAFEFGAGVFTDRSHQVDPVTFPNAKIHRWGGSLAVRLPTVVRLSSGQAARTIMFETTLAVRYAYGEGSTTAVRLTYPDASPHLSQILLDQQSKATQHLLTAHVGSGMRF